MHEQDGCNNLLTHGLSLDIGYFVAMEARKDATKEEAHHVPRRNKASRPVLQDSSGSDLSATKEPGPRNGPGSPHRCHANADPALATRARRIADRAGGIRPK